jgi:hypothetical protein
MQYGSEYRYIDSLIKTSEGKKSYNTLSVKYYRYTVPVPYNILLLQPFQSHTNLETRQSRLDNKKIP